MIETALIISLIVLTIHYTYQEGEIFEFVSRYGKFHLPEKLHKPVFSCPICQTPWYGTPIYLIGHHLNIEIFSDNRWYYIAFVIVIAMGMNVIFSKINQQ